MIDLARMKERVNLTMPVGRLRELHDAVYSVLQERPPADQQAMLLIMEQAVLEKVGHVCTIKFGKNEWSGKRCSVCQVPMEGEGQAVWLISRWENASVFLCLCEKHASETFEVDIDILTGALTSKIGHP